LGNGARFAPNRMVLLRQDRSMAQTAEKPAAPSARSDGQTNAPDAKRDTKPDARADKAKSGKEKKKPRSRWRWVRRFFYLIVILLIGGRLALPGFLRWYVNRTIDQNPLYDGRI